MTPPSRTISGKLAKYAFVKEPIVWVEGPTDPGFYQHPLSELSFRFEIAGCRPDAERLAEAIIRNDLPYVVVLDGDYVHLQRERSPHRRVVMLRRYAMENYLLEEAAVVGMCSSYAEGRLAPEECLEAFGQAIAHVHEELRDLVALDVANWLSDSGLDVVPRNIAALLTRRGAVALDRQRIADIVEQVSGLIPRASISTARSLVDSFLERGRLVDLLPGHFALSLARELISDILRTCNRRPTIDNKGLVALLAVHVWKGSLTRDHASLRRRLRLAVRDAAAIRGACDSFA